MTNNNFRHQTEEKDNCIRITLPSKKKPFAIIWVVIWLIFWGFMAYGIVFLVSLMIATVRHTEGFSFSAYPVYSVITIFMSLFLFCLLSLGAMGVYSFLWQIGGREIIKANTREMNLVRQVFVWKRTSKYTVNEVSNFRIAIKKSGCAPIGSIRHLLGRDGIIAFDYGTKKYWFGLEIEVAEAKEIIAKLQQQFHAQNEIAA